MTTTISYPGNEWVMRWNNGRLSNFQLDIVGFLAVLGEGSVTANAQVSALSTLFYLPRLIPAPQALLWPARPTQLTPTKATVTGVESGILKDHVHHVAHILLGDNMPPFDVRCVKVTKRKQQKQQSWQDRMFRGEPKKAKPQRENGIPLTNMDAPPSPITPTITPPEPPPLIKAKANGPMAWVTLLSFFLSVTLFILSIIFGDGFSLLATILLSVLSTLIGIVNKWNLRLPRRPPGAGLAPQCHVVIRYPNGSFLVVKCDEDVARGLYFAPEEIEYNVKSPAVYRLISLAGTLMLMGGVITLANARLQLQVAWAGAYILTNAAHFVAAAVPSKMHWDLSCYRLEEQSIAGGPHSATFTDALFKAIVLTKNIAWIRSSDAAPRTKVWDNWLVEADDRANEVGHEYGPLITPNPIWRSHEKENGTIWNVPETWQPKEEWDRINREYQTESADSRSGTTL